jgi:hypothetical protein
MRVLLVRVLPALRLQREGFDAFAESMTQLRHRTREADSSIERDRTTDLQADKASRDEERLAAARRTTRLQNRTARQSSSS